jgi:hypothetical protein
MLNAANPRIGELQESRSLEGMMPHMAKKVGFTIKREISLGVLLQLLTFLVSGVYFVARFEGRMEFLIDNQAHISAALEEVRAREERIEKYLSTKDVRYWQTVKTLEEENRK